MPPAPFCFRHSRTSPRTTQTSGWRSRSSTVSPTSPPSGSTPGCGSVISSRRDMIAVRIGPEVRIAVAGSPTYFADREKIRTPKDLTDHNCINLRTPTHGGVFVWEFEKARHALKVRVDGQFVFNTSTMILEAGLAGLGLIYLIEGQVQP